MEENKYIIQAADDCLKILFLLCTPEFAPQTEQEIMGVLGFKRDKVFRSLKTMEHNQLVKKVDGKWQVTPEIIKLSEGFRRHIASKRAELEGLEREYL